MAIATIMSFALLFAIPPGPKTGIDRLIGTWLGTGSGIVKVEIRAVDHGLRMRVYGQCSPMPCDWGDIDAQAYSADPGVSLNTGADAISADYRASWARHLVAAHLLDDDQLQLEIFVVFTDDNGRAPYHRKYILRRAPQM